MLSCKSVNLHLAAQATWTTIGLYTLTDLAQGINIGVFVGLCHEGMQPGDHETACNCLVCIVHDQRSAGTLQ